MAIGSRRQADSPSNFILYVRQGSREAWEGSPCANISSSFCIFDSQFPSQTILSSTSISMSYINIPSSEDLDTATSHSENPTRRSLASRCITTAKFLGVAAIAIASTLAATQGLHRGPLSPESCGSSPSEALACDCHFDVMSFSWLPLRCFDPELMEQFISSGNWTWYADTNGTTIVPYESVATGGHDRLFVTQEFHLYHCTYMWRKMHRAVLSATPLDGYIGDYHHTSHCEGQLVRRGDNSADINTSIYTKYAECPYEQVDRGKWGWYRMVNGRRIYRGE